MWKGYEAALTVYGLYVVTEWRSRGFNDSMLVTFQDWWDIWHVPKRPTPMPPWLGSRALHRSHRSNLIRKLPAHYKRLWPRCPADLLYVWPLSDKE